MNATKRHSEFGRENGASTKFAIIERVETTELDINPLNLLSFARKDGESVSISF